MSVKLYLLFCSHCSYKRTTDGSDLSNLREVKTCTTCGGARQFKCPQCGYLMRATKANTDTQDKSMIAHKKLQEQQKERFKKQSKEQQRRLRERRMKDDEGNIL